MQYTIIFCALTVAAAFAFVPKMDISIRKSSLSMSDNSLAASLPKNVPRKIKRGLRSVTAETLLSKICNPDFESFLINVATVELNEKLLSKIQKSARKLGVTLKPSFGVKPAIVYKDIVDSAVSAGTFGTLVAAVQAAGLVDTLKGTGPLTVLAPSEEAFAKLAPGTLEGLLADIPQLTALLTFHVLPAQYKSKKIARLNGEKIVTVNGKTLAVKVDKKDQTVSIEGAKFLTTDIKCSNGMIHVIDTVLIPK
eukprot:gene14372-30607_t